MKRILVVTVNWLGDAIMTTPVFKAIREHFPDSYIGVMTVSRVKEVFENNPYINEIIVFDEKGGEKSVFSKLKFVRLLKGKKFDTAFFIHRSFTRVLLCLLAGIKERIGYKRTKNLFVLTTKIEPPGASIHRQDYYLYLFEKSGIAVKDKSPMFFISDAGRKGGFPWENADKHSYLVGMNPSANWELKRWPRGYFAELADRLTSELNCAVVFFGAKKDRDTVDGVIKHMRKKSFNLCGATDLKELAAMITKMNLFISNDSGPAHLAAALGVNTIALFGPTSDKVTSPRGDSVKIIKTNVACEIPCYNLDCKDNVCMKNITVDEVFKEAGKMLAG